MDTGDRTELLAAHLSVAEMCDYVGADTLAFIDMEGLTQATGAVGAGFCNACLTGDYPVEVPVAPPDSIAYPRRAPQFDDAEDEAAPSLWATGNG